MREEFANAHPFWQLVLLSIFALIMAFIAGFAVLLPLIFQDGVIGVQMLLSEGTTDPKSIFYLKIAQISQAIGMFVLPFLVYRYFARQSSYNYGFTSKKMLPVLVFAVTMGCAFPLVTWLGLLNYNLHLPEALSGLEEWIYATEASAEALIKKFLYMETVGDLVFNAVLIALVPAVSEELCFRGMVQPLFQRWFRNEHVAVWVTAFVFAFIHFQFLGFLPRFLLGALLGYAALWSNSLLVPMAGHFINNGIALMAAWFIGPNSLELDYTFFEPGSETTVTTVLSLVIVAAGMWFLHWIKSSHAETAS